MKTISWCATTCRGFHYLQALLRKQRQDSAVRIDSLEQALADLRKEYNEVNRPSEEPSCSLRGGLS